MPSNKIEITYDGSHSIFSEKFDALYHSKHGAIQESMHIFIEAGLNHRFKDNENINILEMGFGTGLNLLLTHIESESKSSKFTYHTVEAYPITAEIAKDLNYLKILERQDLEKTFVGYHESTWNETHELSNQFSYQKHLVRLEDSHFDIKFDLVFYDAFAPECQEELWTVEIFSHIVRFLNPGAVLVSYCAKGDFKRALLAAGFDIEKIPGPPGKREMIRATYNPKASSHH